jgi:hypothetical protein
MAGDQVGNTARLDGHQRRPAGAAGGIAQTRRESFEGYFGEGGSGFVVWSSQKGLDSIRVQYSVSNELLACISILPTRQEEDREKIEEFSDLPGIPLDMVVCLNSFILCLILFYPACDRAGRQA